MAMELKQAIEITEKQTETSLMIQSRRDAFQQVLEAAKRYERYRRANDEGLPTWDFEDIDEGRSVVNCMGGRFKTCDEAFDALYGRGE